MKKRLTKKTKLNIYNKIAHPYFGDLDDKYLVFNSLVLTHYTDKQLEKLLKCDEPIITNYNDLILADRYSYIISKDQQMTLSKLNQMYDDWLKKVITQVLENRVSYQRQKKLENLLDLK